VTSTYDNALTNTTTEMCQSSSSSRMRVMNHNWSAMKQCLHLQRPLLPREVKT